MNQTASDIGNNGSGARQDIKITLVSFAYFFFVICSYYVIKPVRESLALELGSENIPILNILSMITLIGGNAVYSLVVGYFKRDIFIPFITKFFVLCLLGFWVMFSFIMPIGTSTAEIQPVAQPLSVLKVISITSYYLWVNLFSLMAVSMFWSFMNDVFTINESKKLYAIIGYGGLVGGLIGSALTSMLAKTIGTPNLFVLAIVLLYPSIWCMQYIHKNHYRPEGIPQAGNQASPAHPPRPWDGFMSVSKNFILILMALEMFFYTFSSTLFSQQFNHMVETELGGVNERTAFVAAIYGKINIVSLITQFFVTRLVMVFANPIYGLLMLNIIQTAATLLMLKMPSLTIVSWTIIIRYALNYSTGRVLRELIYIPLDHEAKYQGKGFIDTVVFRFGDGLSSVVIFGGLQLFSYGKWIDFSILLAMAAQFYVIIKAANMYAERLHETGTDGVEPAPAGQ